MGTLGLCPLALRWAVLPDRSARRGAHNQLGAARRDTHLPRVGGIWMDDGGVPRRQRSGSRPLRRAQPLPGNLVDEVVLEQGSAESTVSVHHEVTAVLLFELRHRGDDVVTDDRGVVISMPSRVWSA